MQFLKLKKQQQKTSRKPYLNYHPKQYSVHVQIYKTIQLTASLVVLVVDNLHDNRLRNLKSYFNMHFYNHSSYKSEFKKSIMQFFLKRC